LCTNSTLAIMHGAWHLSSMNDHAASDSPALSAGRLPSRQRLPAIAARDVLGGDIAARLAQDIITLRLAPASRLIEEDVSHRFGVSRSPVREAVRILEADGLIERTPRRGSIVAPMSRANLDAVYACRLPLEVLASAGTARGATPAVVKRLRDAYGAMCRAHEKRDPSAAFLANRRLTDTLHEACGNDVLRRLLSGVDKLALRYRYFSYGHAPAFLDTTVSANGALLDAIAAGNEATAATVTEQLIRESWRSLQALLEA
jgi:DNA-binding GntR family transcriptional regulator